MFAFLAKLITGGAMDAITTIATEAIETDKESAEAKALFIKTLDPNGTMRRQLSVFASSAYGFYLVVTSILIFMTAFGIGGDLCTTDPGAVECISRSETAAKLMTDLFLPITTAWGGIVGASFGVNGVNSYKGRP